MAALIGLAQGVPQAPTATLSNFGYGLVGMLGFSLAAVAASLFRKGGVPADLVHRRSRARRLLLGGLSANTILCALILVATWHGSYHGEQMSPIAVSNAIGTYLLVGGDILSGIYLVLIAAMNSCAISPPESGRVG